MITSIFPVNILVKDFDMPDSWLDEIEQITKSAFVNHKSENNLSYSDTGDNEVSLFTKNNLNQFPILSELTDIFVEGFYELASSYEDNQLTKEYIKERVLNNTGKLPFMKKGDYKMVHNHAKASAFAIFYLSDVDNIKHGGQLILRDPAFHSNYGFHPVQHYPIDTRKNRLIVVPGYIWHEVTPYTGDEERISIVMNLDF